MNYERELMNGVKI